LDYYTAEELSVAKDLLLREAELIDIVTFPKISRRRRDSVNKPQLDLDDLFTILTDLDENRNIIHLPLFCATSPDKMPSKIRLVDSDLAILWNKLAEFHEILMSDRNDHMKYIDAMTQNSDIIRDIQKEIRVIGQSQVKFGAQVASIGSAGRSVRVSDNAVGLRHKRPIAGSSSQEFTSGSTCRG